MFELNKGGDSQIKFEHKLIDFVTVIFFHGVVVRASASQSVELGYISLSNHAKGLKNGIRSFLFGSSARRRKQQANSGKLAYCVFEKDTY